tara:strand:+ start:72296 stop:73264 length:969 start_codon:yes stop_codon:yes gene_type:complete
MRYFLVLPLLLLNFSFLFSQENEVGGIIIQSNIKDYFLIIDNDFENAIRITEPDTIFLPTGKYPFKLASPYKNDYLFISEIFSDSIINKSISLYSSSYNPRLSSYATLFWDSNLMVFSEEGAEIYVNDQLVGTSGAAMHLNGGLVSVRVKNDGHTVKKNLSVIPNKLQAYNLTTLPIKRKSQLFSFVPGASQFYKEQPLKGSAFLISFFSVSTVAYIFNQRFLEADNNFIRYRNLYNRSENPVEVFQYAILAEENLNNAKKYSELRDLALIGVGTVYLLNVADGFFTKPKRGFFEPWDFDPYINFNPDALNYYGITISRDLK